MTREHMVGIISDTHDHRRAIAEAVSVFNDAGCSLVVHAGDIVAPFTIRELGKLEGRFLGVFGNNDGEKKGLSEAFASIGTLHEPPYEFLHSGARFVLMHAPDTLELAIERRDVDVIVYGHTHEVDIRPGRPLVINPGECCFWLSGRATVALLDLSTRRTELVDLEL
jgi:uncharacterized protein